MLLNVTGLKSKHVTTPARIVLRLYTGLLEHLRCVVTLRECQPKPEPLLSRLEHDEVVGFAIACETDEVLVVLGLKLVIDRLDELNQFVHNGQRFLCAALLPERSRRRGLDLNVVVNHTELYLINLGEREGEMIADLDRAHLKCDKRDEAI